MRNRRDHKRAEQRAHSANAEKRRPLEAARLGSSIRGPLLQTANGRWKVQTAEGVLDATPEETAYAQAQVARSERYRQAHEDWDRAMAKWPRGLKWLGRWLSPAPDWRRV